MDSRRWSWWIAYTTARYKPVSHDTAGQDSSCQHEVEPGCVVLQDWAVPGTERHMNRPFSELPVYVRPAFDMHVHPSPEDGGLITDLLAAAEQVGITVCNSEHSRAQAVKNI